MVNAFFLIVGRLCLSLIFLIAGFDKLLNLHDTEKELITALTEWQGHMSSFQTLQNAFTFLVSWSSLLLITGVTFELLGGLMILTGFKDKLGAVLLILFLIPATLLFHDFWFLEDAPRQLQTIMFLKNLALIGGLIFVATHGVHQKKEEKHSFMGLG